MVVKLQGLSSQLRSISKTQVYVHLELLLNEMATHMKNQKKQMNQHTRSIMEGKETIDQRIVEEISHNINEKRIRIVEHINHNIIKQHGASHTQEIKLVTNKHFTHTGRNLCGKLHQYQYMTTITSTIITYACTHMSQKCYLGFHLKDHLGITKEKKKMQT